MRESNIKKSVVGQISTLQVGGGEVYGILSLSG